MPQNFCVCCHSDVGHESCWKRTKVRDLVGWETYPGSPIGRKKMVLVSFHTFVANALASLTKTARRQQLVVCDHDTPLLNGEPSHLSFWRHSTIRSKICTAEQMFGEEPAFRGVQKDGSCDLSV